MILPVILCGGNGSRLWPLSRSNNPKQFLPLLGDDTMLQATIARLEGLNCSAPMLVCGESHRFIAAEQLRQLGITGGKMILEPVGRNTAPAIALAALHAQDEGTDPLLMVLAADHVITQPQAFRDAIATAMPLAEQGELVTFGIVAKGPETGYGYIKCGSKIAQGFRVDSFVEKPNLKTAQEYLSSGDYYWNSGMFLIRASRYLEELKCHNPEILSRCEMAMAGASIDADFIRIEKKAFLVCPDESIDYAVM